MPTITIKENDHSYDETEIITFAEGLIGLPQMRRAVLIAMNEFEPFCWLASIENDNTRFIVVNPREIFEGYEPFLFNPPAKPLTLTIVKISSDWTRTTVNLRAPIVIDPETKRGAQHILTESDYQFAESIPRN
jgi:flagellar assembly factor FliW